MVALPNKESFTGPNVSQGSFKDALDDLRDYLAGVLGADGTAAAARAALGLSNAATTSIANINYALIPQGTRMVFHQASAPPGWTQDTSVNDRVLRVVSGQGGSVGGSWTISGLSVAGHQLTINEMPSHRHTGSTLSAGTHSHGLAYTGDSGSMYDNAAEVSTTTKDGFSSKKYKHSANGHTFVESTGSHSHALVIELTGGSQAHSHGISHDSAWRPAYIDVIVCSKD